MISKDKGFMSCEFLTMPLFVSISPGKARQGSAPSRSATSETRQHAAAGGVADSHSTAAKIHRVVFQHY